MHVQRTGSGYEQSRRVWGRDTQPILVEALLSSLRVNVSLLFEVLMGSRPQAEGSVKCGSL